MTLARTATTDASAIAEQAFVFAYPLVLMELTRAAATAVTAPSPETMRAPMNRMVHARSARERPADQAQPPNADMLCSAAWLDLRAGPVALSVPDTHGRYYVLTMFDMWTEVFGTVGARTTGTGAGTYAITGPEWHGSALPAGVLPIAAPTHFVEIIGHTQADDDEQDAARVIQDGYRLWRLGGRWQTTAAPGREAAPAAEGSSPVEMLDRMDPATFFAEVARLLRFNPPHAEDWPIVARVREAGLLGSWDALTPATRDAVEEGVREGAARVRAEAESPAGDVVGRWRVYYELGRFGTDYLRRAGAARAGLAAEPAADELPALANTDADGRPLSGRHHYVLRFAPDAPPPVNGFWSLTTYGEGTLAVQEWRSIGDRHGLMVDLDGSLPIHIQHERPAREREAPSVEFNVVLRLYCPRGEVLGRDWVPPALTRVDR